MSVCGMRITDFATFLINDGLATRLWEQAAYGTKLCAYCQRGSRPEDEPRRTFASILIVYLGRHWRRNYKRTSGSQLTVLADLTLRSSLSAESHFANDPFLIVRWVIWN